MSQLLGLLCSLWPSREILTIQDVALDSLTPGCVPVVVAVSSELWLASGLHGACLLLDGLFSVLQPPLLPAGLFTVVAAKTGVPSTSMPSLPLGLKLKDKTEDGDRCLDGEGMSETGLLSSLKQFGELVLL